MQPRVLIEKVLPQLDAIKADDDVKSLFQRPVTKMPEEFPAAEHESHERNTAS